MMRYSSYKEGNLAICSNNIDASRGIMLIEINQIEKYHDYIILFIYQIYYSAIKKNTFESVLMWWMKLEPIIQSEVSQKEKHQYSILTHIYGI